MRRMILTLLIMLAAAGCASSSSPTTKLTVKPAVTVTPPTHIVLVMLENKPVSVLGQMPYLQSLANAYGTATNYWALNYPSLPNYIRLTSGQVPSNIAGKDCLPSGSCTTNVPSIFGQLNGNWRVWAESMPSPCYKQNTTLYAPRHTAAPYYTSLSGCLTWDVPLPATPTVTAAFTLVTPNLCHDAHNCSAGTADTWLKGWLPKITGQTAYTSGATLIEVTFDSGSNNCGASCPSQVALVLERAGMTHHAVSTKLTDCSLLRLNEELLAVPLLGCATSATDMRAAFGL